MNEKNKPLEEKYKNPIIPKGYSRIRGKWDTGIVIQNVLDKSEFTWIPVGALDNDGTLDGENFCEKFGRRKHPYENYKDFPSYREFTEEVSQDIIESVNKYGGFYISSYHASNNNGKPVFLRHQKPWVEINYYDAETLSSEYAKDSTDIKSCITNGACFDCMLMCIKKFAKKDIYGGPFGRVATPLGNLTKLPGPYADLIIIFNEILPTGHSKEWCAFNIYDFAGNVSEWTSEKCYSAFRYMLSEKEPNERLRRGLSCCDYDCSPSFPRFDSGHPDCKCTHTSFRTMLYLV